MSERALDQSRPVRKGDELDLEKLAPYLRAHLPGADGPLSVEQFPRGHSNLTYLLKLGEREVVLRRPPPGAKEIKAGHDMGREYRMLSRLLPVYPRVPRPLLFCDEAASPLGVPFYVMERVRGVILRTKPPEGIPLTPEVMRQVSEGAVDNLVALHAVDYAAAGLGDLGKPQGYVARQVSGWTERYKKAKTDDLPQMDQVMGWLAEHLPPEGGAAVIHNDYKYDNLVLDPASLGTVRAVLDWELATLGDPLADLGSTLAYWIDTDDPEELVVIGLGLTTLPGNLNREGVLQRYAQGSGRDVSSILFHFVNSTFKVAVIAQQLYYRYKQGFTQDERFGMMLLGVQLLAKQAARAIELQRIWRLG